MPRPKNNKTDNYTTGEYGVYNSMNHARVLFGLISPYLDLADKYRREKHDKEDICDDIIFEMELVKQVEVNIDYILFLVQQYHEGHQQDMEIRVKINKAIDSSPDLRDKKELIDKFIDDLTPDSDVDADWKRYVNREKREQFDQIITEEHLKRDKAVEFIENAGRRHGTGQHHAAYQPV